MNQVVITGAPGTGKTAIVDRLARTHHTVPEPARRVIAAHTSATGEQNLDNRPEEFVARLTEQAVTDYETAPTNEVVIFDRSVPDCVAYATSFGVDGSAAKVAAREHRISGPIFIAPPWQEIYVNDEMRKATFKQVVEFHEHLVEAYTELGYELIDLPLFSIEDRVAMVRQATSSGGSLGRR